MRPVIALASYIPSFFIFLILTSNGEALLALQRRKGPTAHYNGIDTGSYSSHFKGESYAFSTDSKDGVGVTDGLDATTTENKGDKSTVVITLPQNPKWDGGSGIKIRDKPNPPASDDRSAWTSKEWPEFFQTLAQWIPTAEEGIRYILWYNNTAPHVRLPIENGMRIQNACPSSDCNSFFGNCPKPMWQNRDSYVQKRSHSLSLEKSTSVSATQASLARRQSTNRKQNWEKAKIDLHTRCSTSSTTMQTIDANIYRMSYQERTDGLALCAEAILGWWRDWYLLARSQCLVNEISTSRNNVLTGQPTQLTTTSTTTLQPSKTCRDGKVVAATTTCGASKIMQTLAPALVPALIGQLFLI